MRQLFKQPEGKEVCLKPLTGNSRVEMLTYFSYIIAIKYQKTGDKQGLNAPRI